MAQEPIIAMMYDFDKTLSPKDMQEYAFIPGIGMQGSDFWNQCNKLTKQYNMDDMLSYMLAMVQESRGKMLITREVFCELGKSVQFFPGVTTWFDRVNKYGEKLGLTVEHYIISSGLKEIIGGTHIARFFKEIYAGEFCYDERGVPFWPAMAVNYTSKTQFLYRINKGVLDVTEHKELNGYTPPGKHRVPFPNMIYIGDGLTDVPCMKLVKQNGGHSIAVYQDDIEVAQSLLRHGRVDYIIPADYGKGSKMENTVFAVLDQVRTLNRAMQLHLDDMAQLDECE
ncbi:MAG: HAD family hydrolase [Clostridia bacterium]